jgi:tyrosine-protein kinase Etk/Wzc
MEQLADVVIIDTPAVLAVADAASVVPYSEATVLVVRAGKTSAARAQRALEVLGQAKATLAGTVLNAAKQRRNSAYDYYRPSAVS